MIQLGALEQHGYCLLAFFRKGAALALAVNLTALPLTLYHFHKFPLMSLIYNLFFPFLVSICMLLLIAALAFSFLLPWLGALLHAVNTSYTKFILNFVLNMPKNFDYTLYFSGLTAEFLVCYMIFLFTCGILLYQTNNNYSLEATL